MSGTRTLYTCILLRHSFVNTIISLLRRAVPWSWFFTMMSVVPYVVFSFTVTSN